MLGLVKNWTVYVLGVTPSFLNRWAQVAADFVKAARRNNARIKFRPLSQVRMLSSRDEFVILLICGCARSKTSCISEMHCVSPLA